MSESNREWFRTMLCGCGECATRKRTIDSCPLENSPDAKWLWSSKSKSSGKEVELEEISLSSLNSYPPAVDSGIEYVSV